MTSFLLYGNGPVSNRGCEAIVLGTKRILEREFGPVSITLASFGCDAGTGPSGQSPAGLSGDVRPVRLPFGPPRFSPAWARRRLYALLGRSGGPPGTGFLKVFDTCLAGARAGLSVGGDGYAIDWGHAVVDRLMLMDRRCREAGIPAVVWGASVGPFDREPGFEARVAEHLRRLELVVVREPRSFGYLRRLGVERNLVLVPDPAFALEPETGTLPEDCARLLERGCIGLNLSPLMARAATGGDLRRWQEVAVEMVRRLLAAGSPASSTPGKKRRTLQPPGGLSNRSAGVLLVPHVISPDRHAGTDDEVLLRTVRDRLDERARALTAVLPRELGAARLRDCIGRTRFFIGARTHATIAALAAGVPTISLAYSRKAWGINELVYGHHDWVLAPAELGAGTLAARAAELIEREAEIRARLRPKALALCEHAHDAARFLKVMLSGAATATGRRTAPDREGRGQRAEIGRSLATT